jgi:hypothetical protein
VRIREKVRGRTVDGIEIPRDGKEAFRPKEPAIAQPWQPARLESPGKRCSADLAGTRMIQRHIPLGAPGLIEPRQSRNSFKQRGLADPVLAHDDGDRIVESLLKAILEQWQAKRIGACIFNQAAVKPDFLEIRRRKANVSFA